MLIVRFAVLVFHEADKVECSKIQSCPNSMEIIVM